MKKEFKIPLINCHTHAAMIAFRGLAEDLSLKDWLEKVIWPMEAREVNSDFVYKNTVLAIEEMKKNWIKCFSDMYFFEEDVAKAAEEKEMNVVLWEAILDFPTPSFKNPQDIFKKTEELILKYKDNKYVKVAVAPHAIFTVCKENLVKAKDLARKYNSLYHIHLSETKEEYENCLKEHNMTPVEYLNSLWVLDSKTLLVHVVYLTDSDVDILAKNKVNIVHCPISNLKLWSWISPISKMLARWVNVCLWTDGAASSNRLDIWEAWKIAALLEKWITWDASILNTKEVIKMMSINWMKALWIDEIDWKTIEDIGSMIDREPNFNFLYEYNSSDLIF